MSNDFGFLIGQKIDAAQDDTAAALPAGGAEARRVFDIVPERLLALRR